MFRLRNLALGALSLVLVSMPVAAQQVLKVGIAPPATGAIPFQPRVMEAVAKDAGLQFTFQEMPFGDLVQALVDKKIDIIAANVSPTPERARLIDFGQNYASFRDVALLPTTDTKSYRTVADFKGMTVAVVRGAFYVEPLKQAGAIVKETETTDLSLAEVEAGRAAAMFIAGPNTAPLLARSPKLKVVDSYTPILSSAVAFSVQKGNAALLAKLDASVAKLKADGTIKGFAEKSGYNFP